MVVIPALSTDKFNEGFTLGEASEFGARDPPAHFTQLDCAIGLIDDPLLLKTFDPSVISRV
jgi:hypothetical protein